jgi:hypothetical protein
MADFVYSTSLTVPGPWLIDQESLGRLDKILDDASKNLALQREEAMTKEINNRWPDSKDEERNRLTVELTKNNYLYALPERELTLSLETGERVRVDSFTKALLDQGLSKHIPVAFDFSLKCYGVSCTTSLSKNSTQLQIKTSPENHPEARDLFASLNQWVTKTEPPRYQQLWRKYANASPIFIGLIPIFLTLAMWLALSPTGTLSTKTHEYQAHELLNKGLSQDDELEAIRLILAMTSQYNPNRLELPVWAWTYVGITFVLLIILAFAPRTLLGIGAGEKKIKRWRTWTKWVFITVPGVLALAVLKKFLGV